MKNLTVLADGTDEAAWLAARIPVITATQAAAIAGSHPYYKLIDVWNEKTDPNHDSEANRNAYLMARAAVGAEREPEIIRWATELPETGGASAPFKPSHALVTRPELIEEFPELPPAATPDAWKSVRGKLVLMEAKTTQQDWESDGLPQHIYDQVLWQRWVTGAVTVWIAVERTEWTGRGANKVATIVARSILKVSDDDPQRLAFLQERVAEFRQMVAEGIAPESDVNLSEPSDWNEAEEFERIEQDLDRLAEIEDEIAAKVKEADAIKKRIKPIVTSYAGRRIHLIGKRRIVKLVRSYVTKRDFSQVDPATLRAITSWSEQETMRVEPNPDYIPPAEPVAPAPVQD